MSVTLSTNVDDKMALKARIIAEKENRSVSNILSSALAVFTSLPKDFRDAVLELQSQQSSLDTKRFAREIMATMSRLRLEAVTKELAGKKVFGGTDSEPSEIDLLEEATQMVEAIRPGKPRP